MFYIHSNSDKSTFNWTFVDVKIEETTKVVDRDFDSHSFVV